MLDYSNRKEVKKTKKKTFVLKMTSVIYKSDAHPFQNSYIHRWSITLPTTELADSTLYTKEVCKENLHGTKIYITYALGQVIICCCFQFSHSKAVFPVKFAISNSSTFALAIAFFKSDFKKTAGFSSYILIHLIGK